MPKVIFELNTVKVEVIKLNYSFDRPTDAEKNQPTRALKNGFIELKIRSDDSGMKGKIANWLGKKERIGLDGKIYIYEDNGTTLIKQITFQNGHLVKYWEHYDSESPDHNLNESFCIAAHNISITVDGTEELVSKMEWANARS
jgi:Hemolysin coregulated protein Hcp (TssD)